MHYFTQTVLFIGGVELLLIGLIILVLILGDQAIDVANNIGQSIGEFEKSKEELDEEVEEIKKEVPEIDQSVRESIKTNQDDP